jgi:hypothetical protein
LSKSEVKGKDALLGRVQELEAVLRAVDLYLDGLLSSWGTDLGWEQEDAAVALTKRIEDVLPAAPDEPQLSI